MRAPYSCCRLHHTTSLLSFLGLPIGPTHDITYRLWAGDDGVAGFSSVFVDFSNLTRRMVFFSGGRTHLLSCTWLYFRFYIFTPFEMFINGKYFKKSNPDAQTYRTRNSRGPLRYEPRNDNANTAFGIFNNRSAYTLHNTIFNMQ